MSVAAIAAVVVSTSALAFLIALLISWALSV